MERTLENSFRRFVNNYSLETIEFQCILDQWHYLTRAACIFLIPFFTAVDIVKQLILQTIYVLNKEILIFFGPKIPGLYNQKRFQIKSWLSWHVYGS